MSNSKMPRGGHDRRDDSPERNRKLTHAELEEIRESFSMFDKNNDGRISAKELGSVLRSLGHNPSNREVHKFVDELDTDGSGYVEFGEFAEMMKEKLRKKDKEKELKEAFKIFDKDNNGYISARELRTIMAELGEKMDKHEIDEIMDAADVDRNGYLDIDEFIRLMSS